MNFLQPFMLYAVPLIALPVVIHLINQRRYQTMQWGAMRFLLAANKMSRGYARIRQWLILACRTIAIAGLIFAACRPLASGLLGVMGGTRADTTIVLLDRSPSMAQAGEAGPLTKREAALGQLVDALKKIGSKRWVFIESDRALPQELESVDALLELPQTHASSASADIPAMLEAAANYIETNKPGRTDIWICSDLRANDWQDRSGRWQTLRDRFLAYPQSIRFQLFGFSQPHPENLAIAVTEVERIDSSSDDRGAELSVSLRLTREEPTQQPIVVPVQMDIGDARSQVELELVGSEVELKGHRIPLDAEVTSGWGQVSIRADKNTADDTFYFAFDKPAVRKTVLIAEDPNRIETLQFAAEVSPSDSVVCQTDYYAPHQIEAVPWEEIALVLWQAPLPQAEQAEHMDAFLQRGGRIIFFPPDEPQGDEFHGVSWATWQRAESHVPVATWKLDQDLLSNTQSGMSLPVGDVQTTGYCQLQGDLTALATLNGGDSLLARLATSNGGVYFCSTTTRRSDSNLADNGAVLYVAVQRALEAGANELAKTRFVSAGDWDDAMLAKWQQRLGAEDAISTSYAYQAGVYEQGDRLVAVNPQTKEIHAEILSAEQLNGLFAGLDFSWVQNEVGTESSLVQEIWRGLLMAMIVALLAEAILCVPRRIKPTEEKNSIFRERSERAAVVKEMRGAAA